MKKLLLAGMMGMLAATSALAADPQVCDVTYTLKVVTSTGHNVWTVTNTVYGLPFADVLDNSAKGLKVVDVMSKLQDKGGGYEVETGEVRTCDGKAPEKVAATSVMVKGLTLDGSNKVYREGLKQADFIVKRYEDRQKKGDKFGWDHTKAKKVKRDDIGETVK